MGDFCPTIPITATFIRAEEVDPRPKEARLNTFGVALRGQAVVTRPISAGEASSLFLGSTRTV